jgi:hypothetical protein
MHPAIRSLLAQLGRRLLLVAIAVGCAVAFIAIAGGTDARTGQPVTMVPVIPSPTSGSADPASQAPIPGAALSGPAHSSSTPIGAVTTVAATKTTPRPATGRSFGRMHAAATTKSSTTPSAGSSRSPGTSSAAANSSPAPTAPPTYHYVATRDVASLINPQRERQGWSDLATAPAKSSAGCLASKSCSGQTGACGMTPSGFGSPTSTRVNDGQYKDQYGNCVELISFS